MSKMNEKILVIASAGGHLTQAMCLTSKCNDLTLVTNKVNIANERIKKIYKIWDTQFNFFIHFYNIFYALYVILRERPKAIISTGGPIALPFAFICKILPLKFVYVDTLSRVVELSNTGKLIHKYSLYDDFFCQWHDIAKKNNVKYIGKCFDIKCENSYELITQEQTSPPVILVTVGTNQYDFVRLFEMLSQQPLYNSDKVKWIIQKGHNSLTHMPKNGQVVDMITRDEMSKLVQQASLVISHCGIGSINQMLSYQKKVIFVPRVARFNEFSDDHQLQIASEIGSELFDVVFPEHKMKEILLDELLDRQLVIKSVDTTNHQMADDIKNILYWDKS
jgi:UDP-N-acetylglucosamine transferase subunit ALG13